MKTTDFICTAIILVIAVYDVVAIYFGGIDASVSRWMQRMGATSPFLIFAAGWLCGHWWGNMTPVVVEGTKAVFRAVRGE